MAALVNFGTTATFPVFELFKGVNSEGAPTVICPSCANPLVPEKLSIFHMSDRVEQTPLIATCPCCIRQFTPFSLRVACLEAAGNLVGGFNYQAELEAVYATIMSPNTAFPVPSTNPALLAVVRADLRCFVERGARPMGPLSVEYVTYIRDILRFTLSLGLYQEHRYRFKTHPLCEC